MLVKGWIQKEDTTIMNMSLDQIPQVCTGTRGGDSLQCTNSGDVNPPLSSTNISAMTESQQRQPGLSHAINERDPAQAWNILPNSYKHTFSSAHGTFPRVDHLLGHKVTAS